MKNQTRQVVNVVATLLVIAAFAWVCQWVWDPKKLSWASPNPLNTMSLFADGSLRASFQKLRTIGAAVHLVLVAFAAYQALPAQREDSLLHRIGSMYAWVCAFNVICVLGGTVLHPGKVPLLPLLWQLLLMPSALIGFVVLIVIFARRKVLPTPLTPARICARICFVFVPLALYLGWLALFLVEQVALSMLSIYPG